MQRFILLILLILINAGTLISQVPELYFQHLTIEEGLSNNAVHCILQDNKGFLWFGSDDGLNRYDGYEFKVFKYNSQIPNSLSSNSVFKIFQDSKGQLWLAQSLGIDIYDDYTLSFKHVPLFEEDSMYYTSYTRAIIEDRNGNILIANTVGVFVYDSLRKGFVRFLKDTPYQEVSNQEGIRAMHIDSRNRIWIGTISNGLIAYDLTKKKLIAGPRASATIQFRHSTYSITESPEGDIWLGTDHGIYSIDPGLNGVHPVHLRDRNHKIIDDEVWDIKFENYSRVWIATDGSGLLNYDRGRNVTYQYLTDENDEFSLNNDFIRIIYIDRQGILWIGTFQGGVNYAQINREKKFRLIRNEKGNSNSLNYNAVGAIFEDSKGNIWFGTDGKGLDKFDPVNHVYTHYVNDPANENSIAGPSVLTVTEDHQGRIWAGGYLMGVCIINPKNGKITRIRNEPENLNSLSNNDVRDILVDSSGYVWIATNGGGLNKYHPRTKQFIHYRESDPNGIVDNWCIKLYQDHQGLIWIGTYNGMSIFDPISESFTNFIKTHETGSLSNNWVYSFAEDAMGNMWVGTANGINYYDRKKQQFMHYPQFNDLPNEVINGIILDDSENLWLSTNAGISKYDLRDSILKHYNISDGLQGNQFIHGSYEKTRSGKIYFGGINGITVFYPDSIRDNLYTPPVYLTDILINFKPAEIGARGSPITKAIGETKKILLTHDQSVFSLRYTALNYINPAKNQYKYMLEGFDKDWNYVNTRREATYTNLVRGNYIFRVTACNNDGIWNEEGASIEIQILPPWWNTWFFRILILVLVFSGIISLYFYRVSYLKRRHLLLEKIVEERTREVNEKNKLLEEQTKKLNKSNTQLEKRKMELEEQSLVLNDTNALLEERQQQIEEQAEELMTQKEELENVNKNLHELNSTKDKFFSIIAHDLKNPFNTVLGFSEILIDRFDHLTDDKKKKYVEMIFITSQNVFALLQNLLEWARTQTDSVKIKPLRITTRDVIEDNINLVSETAGKKGIPLEFKLSEVKDIYADRNMVDTILRNLLINAIKFSESGKSVQVTASENDKYVEIEVKDQGIGIAREDLPKLFRVDSHITREGTKGETGTGLGLILCKEYIEKIRGKINVNSEQGQGTSFIVSFPAYDNSLI